MTIAAAAPAWLVGILFLLLGLAAVEDGWRLRISNLVVLGVAISGLAAMAFAPIGWDAWQPLLLVVAILAVGTPLFAAGWLGGGDVKVLAASGTWFMLDGGWKMLAAVAVIGGLLTLVALALRRLRRTESNIALFKRGIGVPYGIAISIGVAATIVAAR